MIIYFILHLLLFLFFFSSRRRHTRYWRDWSSDVCSSDLHRFDEAPVSIEECMSKDKTYAAPLFARVRFIVKETGELREQDVFMGDFPLMTNWGTFIINGTERVVVTQLVRSPGAYVMEPKDASKQVLTASLMPARGSWLEFEVETKGYISVRIDRKRKLPVTVLLKALDMGGPEELIARFEDS